MVKFLIIKVDHPNCFLGQDLSLFENVSNICNQIKNSNSKILPCSEVILHKIYLADFNAELVRVRILNAINSNTFRCLLIDIGKINEIRKQKLYNLPLNQLDIDPAIKMIKIPGIRPSGMNDSIRGSNIMVQLSESDKWMPASYKFVSRLFEDRQIVHINYLKQLTKDKMLADVSVIYMNKRENLKDLLINQGYAFLCKDHEMEGAEKTDYQFISEEKVLQPIEADQVSDTSADSIENESISYIIEKMKLEDKNVKINQAHTYTHGYQNNNYEDSNTLSINSSGHGTLDELSQQILQLKVKCWMVMKSKEKDSYDQIVTKYEYKDTIKPICSYKNDFLIHKFLKDALTKYNTKILLLIQAFMIPTLLRGVNMLAIAPSKKGKSMGMLMPILQRIATKKNLPTRSYNPLVVILCSSWIKVSELTIAAERFTKFIQESDTIRRPSVVGAYAGSMKKMTMLPILQGCDILIITPICLLNWLKHYEFFKLNELEMFCLDDAENIIAEHLETLMEIMIYKKTGAIDRGSEPGQYITATNWTSGLESYVKHEMGDVFSIAVNDPLELAVIGRMKQKIIEYDDIEGELYQKLVSYLELTESTIKRTIIFGSDDCVIASVFKYIMQKVNVDLKLMTGAMSPEELNSMVKEWNQYRGYINMPILLISDEALRTSDISIFNADVILHVDINEISFGNRLNFLRDKYSELTFLKSKQVQFNTENEKEKSNSFIFICPKTINLTTANFLYKFLGRCNSDRPVWLKEKAVDFILNKEKTKGCNEICPRIKGFGECKLPGCTKRHMVMADIDKPLLSNTGCIKFRLLHLESPSHFYVRAMEFTTLSGSNISYKSQYLSLKMKMSSYYSNTQNIHGVNLRLVQPGLIAVIQNKDLLERVIVDKLKSKSGYVLVKLIDKGCEMAVEQADLLHVPREISEIPPQAIEIYVTGIKPIDNDGYYNEESCEFARDFLQDNDYYGLIKLCIGSTLWIDVVTQRIHHAQTKITVFDKNLTVTMLDKNLVDKNPNHLDKLVRLCTGKIDIWKQDIQENSITPLMRKFTYDNKAIVFQTLSIMNNDDEIGTECRFANLISPNFIFMNKRSIIPTIKEIQTQILSLINYIETLSIKDITRGTRVLFYKDETWRRGYIINVNSEVTIFSLDWGSIETFILNDCQLKKLPYEYQELPYQAIICSLHYCSHYQNSYSSDVVSAIKHYVMTNNKNLYITVYAYNEENINGKMFCDTQANDIPDLEELDLFKDMKRYSVTITNEKTITADEKMHYVLIRNQNVLPSMEFIYEILPECRSFASRLVRNGSIPHLISDLLTTKDHEKRLKICHIIERIIDKKKEIFIQSGTVSTTIPPILNSLIILMHFINERSIFKYVYRCLNMLLNLAYEMKYDIVNEGDNEKFSIKFVTSILLDYQSATFHILRHLEIAARCGQIDDCQVILDNLRMLLLDPFMVTSLFDTKNWCSVLATCIGALQLDETVYTLLMDILVQIVMLSDKNKPILIDILTQCCLAFNESDLPSVWNTSLSLISCFVNLQRYSNTLRDLRFFDTVFDKFVNYYINIGRLEELHTNALEILVNMWRNGSANKVEILSRRKLSIQIENISKENPTNVVLSTFVTDILVEESSVSVIVNSKPLSDKKTPLFVPDADFVDWVDGREISSRKYKQSYGRIYNKSDSESSSNEMNSADSDSDSSDVAVTPFLDGNVNPADEDNVPCFEKA